jgi:hypothetical protein
MPQLATFGVEDTEPVDLSPPVRVAWHQRFPGTVVAGGLGIFLLAAIAFAVITVSNESTRPPDLRVPATSLTPIPSVTTASPSVTLPPSPTGSPSPAQPSDSPSAPPSDSPSAPVPTPPTVTETASTITAPPDAPATGWPVSPGSRWRRLFPRLFGGH